MKTQMNTLLNRVDTRLAACAAAAGASLAVVPSSDAFIVYSGPVSLNIPSTTAGLYLNVVTGVNNTNPALVPGWDVNPFSSTALSFFNPAAPAGGVYVVNFPGGTSATAPDNLPFGTLISAASGFGSGVGETTGITAFLLNSSNNLVGFRFTEPSLNGGAVAYGWMRISLSGTPASQPRLIVEYAYENGMGVGIPAGAIPEPSTIGLLGLVALGALGVRAWRGRKAA